MTIIGVSWKLLAGETQLHNGASEVAAEIKITSVKQSLNPSYDFGGLDQFGNSIYATWIIYTNKNQPYLQNMAFEDFPVAPHLLFTYLSEWNHIGMTLLFTNNNKNPWTFFFFSLSERLF